MINKKNEKAFFSVLKEVNSNLINCNIKYWLDAGLLLKHTRGQSLFPSSDIDFGVKSDEIKNLIKFTKIMNKKGYVINTIGSTPVIFEGLNLLKFVEKKKYYFN